MTAALGVMCSVCGVEGVVRADEFHPDLLRHRPICRRVDAPWCVVWRRNGVELSATTRSIIADRFAATTAAALGAVVARWEAHVEGGAMTEAEHNEAVCRFFEGSTHLQQVPLDHVRIVAIVIPQPEAS